MGKLVTELPVDPKPPVTLAPTVASKNYDGPVVDTRYDPEPSLLTHLEGSKVLVDYFSQLLGADQTLAMQNVTRPEEYQQYKRIKNYEFRLQGSVTYEQNQSTKKSIENGSAVIRPFVIPNTGDMFVMDMGDGRPGLYTIKSTTRKSRFKETAFLVDFTLVGELTEEAFSDLKTKTQETYVYYDDFLLYGQNPLLLSEDADLLMVLKKDMRRILADYIGSFSSAEYMTLCVPGQGVPTYDPFIAKGFHYHFDSKDDYRIQNLRVLNVSDNPGYDAMTIWDALRRRDAKILDIAVQKVGFISAQVFTYEPFLDSIRFSGIQYVLAPADPELTVNYQQQQLKWAPTKLSYDPVPGRFNDLARMIESTTMLGFSQQSEAISPDMPTLKPVTVDNYYIFSQAFYRNTPGDMSVIEYLTQEFLRQRPINLKLLAKLVETQYMWFGLERFYYTPILLILMQAAIRGL